MEVGLRQYGAISCGDWIWGCDHPHCSGVFQSVFSTMGQFRPEPDTRNPAQRVEGCGARRSWRAPLIPFSSLRGIQVFRHSRTRRSNRERSNRTLSLLNQRRYRTYEITKERHLHSRLPCAAAKPRTRDNTSISSHSARQMRSPSSPPFLQIAHGNTIERGAIEGGTWSWIRSTARTWTF